MRKNVVPPILFGAGRLVESCRWKPFLSWQHSKKSMTPKKGCNPTYELVLTLINVSSRTLGLWGANDMKSSKKNVPTNQLEKKLWLVALATGLLVAWLLCLNALHPFYQSTFAYSHEDRDPGGSQNDCSNLYM